ncbi:MAG: biotin--[acetyl-CoA-carboxylase] ligase [Cyanobacteria bacterium J06559_3]
MVDRDTVAPVLYLNPVEHWRIIEALNRPAAMLGVLPELATLRPKLNLHVFDTVASTNQSAWELVAQGAGAGTVVIARQQTAGRGQWGRTWVSATGGLYLSLVLEPELAIAEATLLTLASAWGIATCLQHLGLPIQLKWPNDLVYEGRKVGGILTETRVGARRSSGEPVPCIQTAVIGIGLNWANPLPPNATSLQQLLPDSPSEGLKGLEDLAAIALRGVLQGYHYWQYRGAAALTVAYQEKLCNLGQIVPVEGHMGQVSGVSSTGKLTVSLDHLGQESIRCFRPGEITLSYNV